MEDIHKPTVCIDPHNFCFVCFKRVTMAVVVVVVVVVVFICLLLLGEAQLLALHTLCVHIPIDP